MAAWDAGKLMLAAEASVGTGGGWAAVYTAHCSLHPEEEWKWTKHAKCQGFLAKFWCKLWIK